MSGPSDETYVGPYRLDRVLGAGGMGTVHLASDTRLGRQVALKTLVGHFGLSQQFLDRFDREATLLGRLDSPHIIPIYDHGRWDGAPYIVMQYAAGGDLGEALRRYGPMPPGLAADICSQVADALAAAHAVGIVHRDVKPGNVLLRDSRLDRPHVYLCDFGVAVAERTGLTATGAVAGTWNYMAPERAEGDPGSPASDVYAVGCLLYEALTGRPPYTGTDVEVALAHINAPVPQLPGTDPMTVALNRVLARAMAKDPAARYASATSLRDELAALAPTPSSFTGGGRVSRRRRGTTVALAAAGVVAVLLAAGLITWRLATGGGGNDRLVSGSSTSPTTSSSPTSAPKKHAVTGDVDGDGRGDLLTGEHYAHNMFWRSTGSRFVRTKPPSYTQDVVCEADVDGDGRLDFLSIAPTFENDVTITIRSPVAQPVTIHDVIPHRLALAFEALACGDVNGDGRADATFWALDKRANVYVYVIVQRSDGTWTRPQLWGHAPSTFKTRYPEQYVSFTVADVNGDGKDDLLARLAKEGRYVTWLSTGRSFRTDGPRLRIPGDNPTVVAGDVDGDGTDEVVSVDAASRFLISRLDPQTKRWRSTLALVEAPPSSSFYGYDGAGMVDVNGDGKDDLVATTYRGVVRVAISHGSSFAHTRRWHTPGAAEFVSVMGRNTPVDWFS